MPFIQILYAVLALKDLIKHSNVLTSFIILAWFVSILFLNLSFLYSPFDIYVPRYSSLGADATKRSHVHYLVEQRMRTLSIPLWSLYNVRFRSIISVYLYIVFAKNVIVGNSLKWRHFTNSICSDQLILFHNYFEEWSNPKLVICSS